jgi:hypothetical protein
LICSQIALTFFVEEKKLPGRGPMGILATMGTLVWSLLGIQE